MRRVYHGSVDIVREPKCYAGRDNLDFGKGFYVTDLRKHIKAEPLNSKARKEEPQC